MKGIVFIPLLIGLGLFAGVILCTLAVVMIISVRGWLATLVAAFGNQERRAAERPVKAGRLARQEKMQCRSTLPILFARLQQTIGRFQFE